MSHRTTALVLLLICYFFIPSAADAQINVQCNAPWVTLNGVCVWPGPANETCDVYCPKYGFQCCQNTPGIGKGWGCALSAQGCPVIVTAPPVPPNIPPTIPKPPVIPPTIPPAPPKPPTVPPKPPTLPPAPPVVNECDYTCISKSTELANYLRDEMYSPENIREQACEFSSSPDRWTNLDWLLHDRKECRDFPKDELCNSVSGQVNMCNPSQGDPVFLSCVNTLAEYTSHSLLRRFGEKCREAVLNSTTCPRPRTMAMMGVMCAAYAIGNEIEQPVCGQKAGLEAKRRALEFYLLVWGNRKEIPACLIQLGIEVEIGKKIPHF